MHRRQYWRCLFLVAWCGFSACDQKAATPKAEPAAKVSNPPKEDQLNTFELTAAAEQRLKIETTAVEKRSVVRVRMYAGEVVLPTGGSIVVSAPLAGFLQIPKKGGIPVVGGVVHKGTPVFELAPGIADKEQSVLTPVDRLNLEMARANLAQSRNDAEAAVEQAEVTLRAAKLEYDRAKRLKDDGAGTIANFDRAARDYDLAKKGHEAALRRQDIWNKIQLDDKTGALKPLTIESPQDGVIRMLHAVAGEGVAAGAVLFEIMNTSDVWVKVPIYAGELGELDAVAAARVSSLEDRVGQSGVEVKPVAAPPTAQALSSTIDLYYAVDNRNGKLRPGQKLNVNIPLDEERESLVIPWSSLVTDINGGTWVYQSLGEQKFARKRVQVRYVVGNDAVLASGPAVGTKIVSEGAAELFGTEFFVTK